MNQASAASFQPYAFGEALPPITYAASRPGDSPDYRTPWSVRSPFITRGASTASAFFEWVRDLARQVPVPEVTDVDVMAEKLQTMFLLEDGWDGRHAPAPSRSAVEVGHLVLSLAHSADLSVSRIAADVEGGVATYFFGGAEMPDGGYRLQVGVLASNDGEVVLYIRDRNKRGAQVAEIEPSPVGIQTAIERIKTLLAG